MRIIKAIPRDRDMICECLSSNVIKFLFLWPRSKPNTISFFESLTNMLVDLKGTWWSSRPHRISPALTMVNPNVGARIKNCIWKQWCIAQMLLLAVNPFFWVRFRLHLGQCTNITKPWTWSCQMFHILPELAHLASSTISSKVMEDTTSTLDIRPASWTVMPLFGSSFADSFAA